MAAYENLAVSYDRLTNDVDYEATVAFYNEILKREGLHPRTAVDLACGTGSVTKLLAQQGTDVLVEFPYAQMSNYVYKINKAYTSYQEIYQNKEGV